jgi:hypothetical protein
MGEDKLLIAIQNIEAIMRTEANKLGDLAATSKQLRKDVYGNGRKGALEQIRNNRSDIDELIRMASSVKKAVYGSVIALITTTAWNVFVWVLAHTT